MNSRVDDLLARAFASSAKPVERAPGEPVPDEPSVETAGSRTEELHPKTVVTNEAAGTDFNANPAGREATHEPCPRADRLTAAEVALGRRIFAELPNLHDWIKRFGGYAKITAEGWAEYAAAKHPREADRVDSLQGGGSLSLGWEWPIAGPETPAADLRGPSGAN